jgi:hypothetical protein
MLEHELPLHFLKSGTLKKLEDEALLHLFAPSRVLLPSSVVLVRHVSFLEPVHDGMQQLHRHFLFRLFGGYLIGQFDKSVEIIGLSRRHPVLAVDQRGFDHFELLSRDGHQLGVDVLQDKIL